MLFAAVMLWVGIIAGVLGALRHLMKRPHLMGEQKLIALLVSSAITVPVCGVLYFAMIFVVYGILQAPNVLSLGEEVLVSALFYGPLLIIVGLGFLFAGNVEDGREVRRQAQARDAILNSDGC